MGYAIERFQCETQEMREFIVNNFKCSICLDIIKNPVVVVECDHVFCHRCLWLQLRYDSRCPLCHTEIPIEFEQENDRRLSRRTFEIALSLPGFPIKKISGFALRLMEGLRINCLYSHNGCEWIGSASDENNHLKRCQSNPNALVTCNRCQFYFRRREALSHDCIKCLTDLVYHLIQSLSDNGVFDNN